MQELPYTYVVEKKQIMVMESDTLGMTVIEQSTDNMDVKQINQEEWVDIISTGKLDGVSYNRIYFSFLKGLPDFLRMRIWLLMCTENSSRNYKFTGEMEKRVSSQFKEVLEQRLSRQLNQENKQQHKQQHKQQNIQQQIPNKKQNYPCKGLFSIFTLQLFQKLTKSKPLAKQSQQIQKDINRTYSVKQKYLYTTPLMRKILYALSNSGVEYTQGMNYILLYVIIFCLQSIGLNQKTFEALSLENQRNIFIILRQIVLRLQQVFENQNIFKVLGQLQQKISATVPDVFFVIYKCGMDTYSLFSQNYYSLLTYSDPPDELTKQMLDLFLLQGYKSITSIIIRMLQISKDQILKIKDPQKMQSFVKNQMFHYCFKTLCQEKINAKSIQDFGISSYHNVDQF